MNKVKFENNFLYLNGVEVCCVILFLPHPYTLFEEGVEYEGVDIEYSERCLCDGTKISVPMKLIVDGKIVSVNCGF